MVETVEAELPGYDEQVKLRRALKLTELYKTADLKNLRENVKNIDEFVGYFRTKMADGYESYDGMEFNTNLGKVAVLLPDLRDNRAISIYTKGAVGNSEINYILDKIENSLKGVSWNLNQNPYLDMHRWPI